jgi:DHA2 family multidrug resistance protein-like MFS transporter
VTTTAGTDGLPPAERRLAVLAIVIGLAGAVLNGVLTNVALPTIARDLQVSAAASIWVVNAFQLAVTVSLLPLAALGEIYGYRRVYIAGLAVFTIASLICAVSDSLAMLTTARVLQGLGGAGMMSVNVALVRFIYPQSQLGRGIGVTVMTVATMAAAGPSVAAAILAVAPWPALFLASVPLGLASLYLGIRWLPRTRRSPHRFDILSALLSAGTLGLLIAALDGMGHGESPPEIAAELVAAGALGYALVRRQRKLPMPLLPVDLFRVPIFALSVATSICSFAAQGIAFVLLPFYFQDVLGFGQVATGVYMTPWPIAGAVVAPIAGRLADRFPVGILAALGMGIMALGLFSLTLMPEHPGTIDIVWRMLLCGLGFGLFQSPNNRALITSAPKERSGAASGVISTARLLGQTTGTALVAVVFGLGVRHGMLFACHAAALLGSGFATVAAIASLFRLTAFGRGATPQPQRGGD